MLAARHGIARPLIVTDAGVVAAALTEPLLVVLGSCPIFDETPANPTAPVMCPLALRAYLCRTTFLAHSPDRTQEAHISIMISQLEPASAMAFVRRRMGWATGKLVLPDAQRRVNYIEIARPFSSTRIE